jgi:hypothetical protein
MSKFEKYILVFVFAALILGVGGDWLAHRNNIVNKTASNVLSGSIAKEAIDNHSPDFLLQYAFNDDLWFGKYVKLKHGEIFLTPWSEKYDARNPEHVKIAQKYNFPPAGRISKWPEHKTIRIIINHEFGKSESAQEVASSLKKQIAIINPLITKATGLELEVIDVPLGYYTNDFQSLFEKADLVIQVELWRRNVETRSGPVVDFMPVSPFISANEKPITDKKPSTRKLSADEELIEAFAQMKKEHSNRKVYYEQARGFILLNQANEIQKSYCRYTPVEIKEDSAFMKDCLLRSVGLTAWPIDYEDKDLETALNALYSSHIHSGMTKAEMLLAIKKSN